MYTLQFLYHFDRYAFLLLRAKENDYRSATLMSCQERHHNCHNPFRIPFSYAAIKNKIGFSIYRICYNNNKCNEFYLDYFVWPAGYIYYLEDHNVLIDPLFENYIKNFDFNGQHFRDFDYTY